MELKDIWDILIVALIIMQGIKIDKLSKKVDDFMKEKSDDGIDTLLFGKYSSDDGELSTTINKN